MIAGTSPSKTLSVSVKTADDADEELGFPRGWTDVGDIFPETERWRALRHTQTVGCQLNELFNTYLGKMVYGPDDEAEPNG